ncbi:sec7 domain containing protein [Sporothrix brasiliensis 5110]|uniref:Sec7 domain containing protein n=1 Tax=Sporothrix brasiliensis 5110 TaxID=1398154 RepID=A0A0C2IQI9_9PEZI|nr:sec7 domain containing protein [Sporothrix brasiliensis 5110]KIH91306.1 sec7 domain containing protein [Sporothrix brasiliensis 5110]
MNADPSRRSPRRRPDLSVNTSRARSNSSSKIALPPLSPPRRNVPVPSSRASSRGSKPPPALGTTVMASSIEAGGVGPNRLRSGTSSYPRQGSGAAADVETFLDMYTPNAVSASGKENSPPSLTMADAPQPPPIRGHRDSHDLSLPSRHVRDSLVSNMLLSLDQFSMGQTAAPVRSAPSFEDHRLYSLSTTTTDDNIARAPNVPTAPRGGGGGGGGRYGSGYNNYSSDFEVPDDASRVSGSISHSRRSNSSSGFQSSLGRINSMRESSLHRGSQPGTPRMMHSRGGKGSKSSSTNSIDAGYVQVLGSQRWAHGFGGRSSSFDLGPRLPGSSSGNNPPPTSMIPQQQTAQQAAQQTAQQTQPWHIEFSNSFFNDAYDDAAPTPTVPGGPRKLTSAPSMPSIPSFQPPPPDPPSDPERRKSVRSSRSATVGRQSQTKFNKPGTPPLPPAFDLDSAPAPNIGYEKSKEVVPPQTAQPQQIPPHPLRQKPSFFRRVFGGFRDTAAENEPVPQLPSASTNTSGGFASSSSVDVANGSRSQQHSSSGLGQNQKQQSAPPSRDSHHSTHATLQKKPSGFFRRRKKSISETESPPPLPMPLVLPPQPKQQPPPPPPAVAQQQQSRPVPLVPPLKMPNLQRFVEKPAPSPVTSLSHAMSPYLKTNGDDANTASPLQPTDLDSTPHTPSRDKGAKPDNADTINRAVRGFSPDYEPPPTATIRSVGPEPSSGKDRSTSGQRHHLETPTRQPPAPPHPARSGSFLSDDSDGDDESPRRVMTKALSKKRSEQSDFLSVSPSAVDDQHLPPSSQRPSSKKSGSQLSLPIEGAASTTSPKARSAGVASSKASPLVSSSSGNGSVHMPIVKVDSGATKADDKDPNIIDEPEFVVGMPTEDDRQKALNIYEGCEDFIQKEKAAAWMGEEGPVRQRTLQAYMELYDFRNQSIVSALRDVCSRLVLRAETQQVDRILVSFSKRWCANNPNHGFKSLDVVHTTCYSIMLLNTDLHLADIESKMTRSQFIKNTMTSIHHTLADSDPKANGRSIYGGPDSGRRPSVDQDRNLAVASLPPRSESSLGHNQDDCGPLVKAPFEGSMRAWESQMEIVLKIIYNSIRDERLPLFGADGNGNSNSQTPNNQSGLSVIGMLKRTPSVISKAPSESQASLRGRVTESNTRAGSSRWTSKSRSRVRGPAVGGPGGAGGATGANGFSSSRTSFEDGNSIWSPTVSSATWSRQSLGRTQTSMSMESFGSNWAGRGGEYQQSIGFANALSQAIIREDALGGTGAASIISDDQSMHQRDGANPLLDDESLELAGPPWVKEGMVVHKHHLDGMDKKAKDRNWTEVFAVVQKGYMSLFSFTPNKSLRAKNRGRNNALPKGAVVGGGNWQENATNVGSFGLKQTLASALPPPGYSRQRPHVWALSLPTGAVHLFQVGTPEICKEFVTTANYWSARLSTHPLVGGISNIEYGWGDGIVNNSLVNAIKSESSTALPSTSNTGTHGPYPPSASRPGSAAAGRASLQSRSSFRSGSFDFGHGRSGSSSSGFTASAANIGGGGIGSSSRHGGSGKLPGDRIAIAEWMPPAQSLRPSNAAEPQQLQTLMAYVQSIESELKSHNALRSPMLLAFTPRGQNATKAMANWERKSSYLLREIVKYRTYVDCLTEAERRRSEIYQEREIARRAARGEGSIGSNDEDNHLARDGRGRGDDDDNNDDETGAETARDDNGDDSDIMGATAHRHRKDSDVLGASESLRV